MTNVKKILCYVAAALLAAVCGYCYGIQDNGTTAEKVREQLNSIKGNQSGITEGIGTASQKVKGAGELIDECIYILQRVRSQPAS